MTNKATPTQGQDLTRRGLFAGAAVGSFVLAVRLTSTPLMAMVSEGSAVAFEPSLFLSIAEDGTVTILAHRSEMGTGIRTTLPMVVADELGADWDRVVIEQAIGDRRLGSQNTDGSQSIRGSYQTMRTVGATARTMFEQAAAAKWNVDVADCKGAGHEVTHKASGKTIGYGELVSEAARLEVPQADTLTYKPKSERTYIGKNVQITDMDVILSGKSVFGIDARRDDQVYAVIARSPVLGAPMESFDSDAAMEVPGVVDVIEMPSTPGAPAFNALGGIAVLATSTWAAIKGREALVIEWGKSEHSDFDSASFERALGDTTQEPGKVFRNDGDVDAAFADADEKHSHVADYYAPLLAHAPMEPPCALAEVQMDDDGNVVHCDVWTATQNPQAAQSSVAGALGIAPGEVVVNVTLLGCGFGRKSKPDYVVEAALLARDMGQPVHVTWTREDDLRHDYYHAVSAMHMRAVVDDDGVPTAWLARSAFTPIGSTFSKGAKDGGGGEMGMGFTPTPFAVPNLRVENGPGPAHVRIGWLRSVAHVYHAFAACSFADELAQKGGWDSYEYLMEALLVEQEANSALAGFELDRLRDVTERVATRAGWGKKLPKGRAMGIASHWSFGSYAANVVELSVSKKGQVTIHKVTSVLDAGIVVHPDRVRAQMEGAAVFGASLTLSGEITAENGAVVQGNFDDYVVARMNTAPIEIDVEIVSSEGAPGGVGEVGVPPFAPAMCNAIFAASGHRIRRLPLSNHDLSW